MVVFHLELKTMSLTWKFLRRKNSSCNDIYLNIHDIGKRFYQQVEVHPVIKPQDKYLVVRWSMFSCVTYGHVPIHVFSILSPNPPSLLSKLYCCGTLKEFLHLILLVNNEPWTKACQAGAPCGAADCSARSMETPW